MPQKKSDKTHSHKGTSLFRFLGRNHDADAGGGGGNAPTSRDSFFRTSDLQTAKTLFERHFDVQLSKPGAPEWTLSALRRAWKAMEKVPLSHIKNNDRLEYFVRREDWSPQSDYNDYDTIRMAYYRGALWIPYTWNIGKGTLLRWKNQFKEHAIHEVGHALDKRWGYSDSFNPAGWRQEGESQVATAFGQAYNGSQQEKDAATALLKSAFFAGEFPKSKAEARQLLRNQLTDTRNGALRAMFWQNGHLDEAKLDTFLESNAVRGLLNAGKSPWTLDDGGSGGGVEIGGRIYQKQPKHDGWWSYDAADRDKRVSNYQYRAQAEWFAEHYTAYYYSAGTRAWLKQHDPYVYYFFERIVDQGRPPPPNLPEGRPAGDFDPDAVFGPLG